MPCAHTEELAQPAVEPAASDGCAECLALGEHDWVQLRLCLTCGRVGCCDSSVHKHATAHHSSTNHPVIRTLEPGQSWRWCYVDNRLV